MVIGIQNMFRSFILILLLTGCSDLLIQEAYYHVDITILRDDSPENLQGHTVEADWQIIEDQGVYRLRVLGTYTDIDGYENGYTLRFIKETEQRCGGKDLIDVIIYPRRNRQEFTGTSDNYISLCEGGGYLIQTQFLGWRIPKPKRINHGEYDETIY